MVDQQWPATQTFQSPSHANLEFLKKKPRKTWRLGPQTFKNMRQIKIKQQRQIICFRELFTLLVLFVVDSHQG